MYVQISCLSVQSEGISSILRTVKTARVASSLVMAIPNGQVTMVESAGISFSAMTLWPEESRKCGNTRSTDGDGTEGMRGERACTWLKLCVGMEKATVGNEPGLEVIDGF